MYILEFINMSVIVINIEGHSEAYFAGVLHQCLNRLYIVFGLMVSQESPN